MSAEYESVLVISDTHVGLPDDEIFREDLQDFIKYLSRNPRIEVEEARGSLQFDIPKGIVLLGDFLDLWDGLLENLPAFSTDFARSLTELADVFYLRGNHDYIIPDIEPRLSFSRKLEISEDKLLNIGGKQFFFIHGHQFMSAFGPASLKIESFVNPFYAMVQSFLSKLTKERGRQVLDCLTIFSIALGLVIVFGQALLARVPVLATLSLWLLFGILLPICFVSTWRVSQKSLYKLFTLIFGELIDSLRGATRGDTIEYLTSSSRPIFRWFQNETKQVEQAKEAGFVVFGHTHIPEGPMLGNDDVLRKITFLNTGSWMRPPSENKFKLSEFARSYTRTVDKFDEWIVVILAVVNLIAYARGDLLPILLVDAIMFTVEILIALGKSSYRRLTKAGLRSLAFIGKDVDGVFRTTLLYWDPARRRLSASMEYLV